MNSAYLKWGFVGAVLVVMLPWWAVVHTRERVAREAIELYTPFAQPTMKLQFRKDIRWDPQGFLGRGRDVGFWDWSEKGVVLTPKGQNIFGDNGKEIAGDLIVGKRQVSAIKSVQPVGDKREVVFFYTWSEFTDASQLFSKPPKKDQEYEATATLTEKDGGWEVTSLTTPEYQRVMDILAAETKHP